MDGRVISTSAALATRFPTELSYSENKDGFYFYVSDNFTLFD